MELEHNFYGVNFAPFPRRGVLSSETAHRSMTAMVEATAANWVILSPSGIQSDPYSEEIDWRTDATPTDEELCSAIRFAKQLGLQVALKPTVNCAKRPWVMGFGVWDWPADPRAASAYAVSGCPAAKIIHSAYQGGVLE